MASGDNTTREHSIEHALDGIMQSRRTVKALGDIHQPPVVPDDFMPKVKAAIESACWAPFHYPAHEVHTSNRDQNSKVPWRFYPMDQQNALKLAHKVLEHPDLDVEEVSTIIRLMAACGAMVMVTWLPEPDDSIRATSPTKLTLINEEHVAAAGAATQNLLLAAKARGIDSYWSSGGVLRDWECFEMCGIPIKEKLLGVIFLYPELPEHIDIRPGKLRNMRGSLEQWTRWIAL